MQPKELLQQAQDCLDFSATIGLTLVIPKGGKPKGFPRGEILAEFKDETVYNFNPKKIIQWCKKNGIGE